jgi:hypothetical protein
MSMPDSGRDLMQTKLDMALKTSEERAQQLFLEVFAMLDYAMVVGHLSPGEFSNWRRLVDLHKLRRQYL